MKLIVYLTSQKELEANEELRLVLHGLRFLPGSLNSLTVITHGDIVKFRNLSNNNINNILLLITILE